MSGIEVCEPHEGAAEGHTGRDQANARKEGRVSLSVLFSYKENLSRLPCHRWWTHGSRYILQILKNLPSGVVLEREPVAARKEGTRLGPIKRDIQLSRASGISPRPVWALWRSLWAPDIFYRSVQTAAVSLTPKASFNEPQRVPGNSWLAPRRWI